MKNRLVLILLVISAVMVCAMGNLFVAFGEESDLRTPRTKASSSHSRSVVIEMAGTRVWVYLSDSFFWFDVYW